MTMTLERSFRKDTAPAPTLEPVGGTSRPRGSGHRAATIAIALAIIFQPILHPAGPGNSSPVDIFTIAAIVMTAIWATGSHHKVRAPYIVPVGLMIGAGAAAGMISLLPTVALTTLAIDLLLFLWCTSIVNVLSAPHALRIVLTAWSWAAIFWAVVVTAAWLGHVTVIEGLIPADGNRVLFTFGDPNYASTYWLSSLFVVGGTRAPRNRWARLAGYCLLLWAMILTESNGGMLALGVGVCFLLLVKSYRARGIAGVAAATLSVCVAIMSFFALFPLNSIRHWAASSGQPLLVNSIGRSAQSSSERLTLISELWQLYQRSTGVLGLGPGSTKPLLTTWFYPYANMAHNDFLAMLTERGPIALLGFLLLIATALFWALPVIRRPLSARFAAAVPAPVAIVAGLIALGTNSFYEEILHFRYLWALLAVVAVIGRDARRKPLARPGQPGAFYARGIPKPVREGTRPVIGGGRTVRVAVTFSRPGTAAPARAPRPQPPDRGRPRRRPDVLFATAGNLPRPFARTRRPGASLIGRESVSNLAAQGGALAAVSLASLMVARAGGPVVVGEYALLRVLPWLFGVVLSCGLPTASAYFLAGEHSHDRRLRPTLLLMTAGGSAAGVVAWLASSAIFRSVFFVHMPLTLVAAMAITVVTQLSTVTAKAFCQGMGDITGANLIIVAEELWFVLCYPVVVLTGVSHGAPAVVLAMIAAGILATLTGVARLVRSRFFTGFGTPSARLAGKVAAFGARGQLGNLLWLMNLRFDFLLLGALAGPATLGIYAVASKFAELMRLAPTAINYVLYPRLARLRPGEAARQARRLLPRSAAVTLMLTPVLGVASYFLLPILYGRAFTGAVLPAEIIIIGLALEGAAAVSSAFLLGSGHPSLNSAAMGLGAVITLSLDLLLIPRYGAVGGAVTSAVTYTATTLTITAIARSVGRRITTARIELEQPQALAATPRPDSGLRRATDVLAAVAALSVLTPLLLLAAVLVKATSRGPVLYRQIRVGRDGRLFTILKFRSMTVNADAAGPLVTTHADPRITGIGRLLRATKIDELPQLWNVLVGDMTLIGPRPEVPRFIPCYEEEELALLLVRPGLTGPGQIVYTSSGEPNSCHDTDADEADQATPDPEAHYVNAELHPKLALDLDYLRRRGLWLDVTIVLRTAILILSVLTGTGRGHVGTAVIPDEDQP